MSCACANKVPQRCQPNTITEVALSDDQERVLVDSTETGLLVGLTRSGSGVEFEYNRQETP